VRLFGQFQRRSSRKLAASGVTNSRQPDSTYVATYRMIIQPDCPAARPEATSHASRCAEMIR